MRFFLIASLVLLSSLVQASSNRAELINLYSENLNKIWKLTDDYPPDFYLSSLGVSLLSSATTSDAGLNAKIQMAAASIFYTAASTSLLMSNEFFKSQSNCNDVFERYKENLNDGKNHKSPEILCPSQETDVNKKAFEISVCTGQANACKSIYQEYPLFTEATNRMMKSFHSTNSNDPVGVDTKGSLPIYMDHFLLKVDIGCAQTNFAWAKKVGEEFKQACTYMKTSILKDNVYIKTSGCKYSVKFPRRPLMFSSIGKNIHNNFCEDDLFQALEVSAGSSIKLKEIFLIGPQLRAVYWMHMAEEVYAQAKKISVEIQQQKLDSKNYKNYTFSFAGTVLCNSPIVDEKFCKPYSQKFQDSINGRSYLSSLSRAYGDINYLGDSYNKKLPVTQNELVSIDRLATEMEKNRSNTLALKNEVQRLINKANVAFSFENELNLL